MGMAAALRRSLINVLAIISALVPKTALTVAAQQKLSPGPFVSEQSATGETAYETTCSTCHAPDLTGREGPQLAGSNFMSDWGGRSIQDLVTYIQTTMPPDTAGSLPQDTAVDIAAFLLQSNGATAEASLLPHQPAFSSALSLQASHRRPRLEAKAAPGAVDAAARLQVARAEVSFL